MKLEESSSSDDSSEESSETTAAITSDSAPRSETPILAPSKHKAKATKFTLKSKVAASLREYQWELAIPGLCGMNYIVCAPTGTGKTLVAGLIISEHLQKAKGNGKVIFIVNKVPLAHQQKVALEEMIHGAKLDEITGDVITSRKMALDHLSAKSNSSTRLQPNVLCDIDILVCTAGCILNQLKKNRTAITDVSLIIIDECHHTRKNSDYAKIMEIYLKEKHTQSKSASSHESHNLPQIIGLTASPGAGDAAKPTVATTLDHLTGLCANLDATGGIKTVTKHEAELKTHFNHPEFSLAVVKGRDETEPMFALMNAIMQELEAMFKLKSPGCSRWSQQYESWVSTTKSELLSNPPPQGRDVISTLELLNNLSCTMTTYSDLQYEDAVDVLDQYRPVVCANWTAIEKQLVEIVKKLKLKLSTLPRVANPLLASIESVLAQQFQKQPESIAIIFVQTKKQASSIHRWIQSIPNLAFIKSNVVTGQTGSHLKMTKSEQSEVITSFREGDYNLIITTSVLEEGIDIPACNLVIRYQKVSSEIAKLQTQGRARAADSHSFSVISSGSQKQYQELLNDEKLAMVDEVLFYLPTGENLQRMITTKQKAILQSAALERQQSSSRQETFSPSEVELVCKKCRQFACNASDIHSMASSLQLIVTDTTFHDRISVKDHHKPMDVPRGMSRTHKIYCVKCGEDWGVIGRWWKDHREFPVLKCNGFAFKIAGQIYHYKKWSEVPFKVSVL